MAQNALFWCPERRGAYREQGNTSRFWNNWRSRGHTPCVLIFSNHWSEEVFELGGSDEIKLEFEMLGGSDSPRFQLLLKHMPSGVVSTFSYPAWGNASRDWPRPVVQYPSQPPMKQYTFSSALKNIIFRRCENYSEKINKLKNWTIKPDTNTYPLQIYWESEEAPIAINIGISTQQWSSTSREKFLTWTKLQETGTELTVGVLGGNRTEEGWSFFASQPSPTLPPWWRYANPVHVNQHTVAEFPLMREGTELFQYHQKLRGDKSQVMPMIAHEIYQSAIEYEVYAIGSLMRSVQYAEESYEHAFNRYYEFSLDLSGIAASRKAASSVYFIQLQVEPWMSDTDNLPSAPGVGTDVKIQSQDNIFLGRIVSTRAYNVIMKVKRVRGTDALILNEKRGLFTFGNASSKFVAERQAIRGVMWGRLGIPQKNWFKAILLGHENLAMSDQSIGISKPHPSIDAHERLNSNQKVAFLHGISFGVSSRARLTIIQGPPGTGKTAVILAFILRAMICGEKILVCAETNSAVRLCAGVLNTYLKDHNLPSHGVYVVQRDALQAFEEEVDEEEVDEEEIDEIDEEMPQYLTEKIRSQLAEGLEGESEIRGFHLSEYISTRLRLLRDPAHSQSYTVTERRLLRQLIWSKKIAIEINIVAATDDDIPVTGPSTALLRYKAPPRVVVEDPEEELKRIREAHKQYEKCLSNVCQYYIGKSTRVVFVTAATSTIRYLKEFHPVTVVMDEASQMTETNTVTVVAQFFPSIQKVILVGDLKQNKPFVGSFTQNEFAKTTEISLMERLIRTGVPSCFLSCQYRMHPDICSTVSKYFYEARLTNAPNVFNRPGDGIFERLLAAHISTCTKHSVFISVNNGTLYSAKKGGSKVNPQYITAVQRLVSSLLNLRALPDQIGILAFYSAQSRVHQDESPKGVHVSTVDAAQGREYDYVVVDTVTPGGRDYSLGFLTNTKKINVALSRARHGLLIVGNRYIGDVDYPNQGATIWKNIVADHQAGGALVEMSVDARRVQQSHSIPGHLYTHASRGERG